MSAHRFVVERSVGPVVPHANTGSLDYVRLAPHFAPNEQLRCCLQRLLRRLGYGNQWVSQLGGLAPEAAFQMSPARSLAAGNVAPGGTNTCGRCTADITSYLLEICVRETCLEPVESGEHRCGRSAPCTSGGGVGNNFLYVLEDGAGRRQNVTKCGWLTADSRGLRVSVCASA